MELPEPLPCDLDFPVMEPDLTFGGYTQDVRSYTSVFVQIYLKACNVPLSNFKRHFQITSVNGQKRFIMRALIDYGNVRLSIFGHGDTLTNASDRCCYELARKILEADPSFLMPLTVQGLILSSNERVYINVIIPLFHFHPFVETLVRHYGEQLRLSIAEKIEDTVLCNNWIILYGKMLQIYRLHGTQSKSLGSNTSSLSSIEDKEPFIASTVLLTQACNIVFSTLNGDDRNAYSFIVKRLTSEMPSLSSSLFLHVECDFTCRACSGGPFTTIYSLSHIQVPYDCNFQAYLSNFLTLISNQRVRSQHVINDYRCTDEVRSFKRASLKNLALLLCFVVGNKFPKDQRRSVADTLTLRFKNQDHIYYRYANTVYFQTYMDKEGNHFGDFYHVPEEGDIAIGEHSYLIIRTQERFIEVNKGLLYEADDRVLPYVFPRSLYFYLHESLMRYLPHIDTTNVTENPLI